MTPSEAREVLIRELRAREVRKLYEIDQICFPGFMAYSRAELMFFLRDSAAITRIAECGGEIIGFAIGRTGPRARAHVITLDVVPEFRRRRVGSMLMNALHSQFRLCGMAYAMLEVDTGNEGAQRFYASLGYAGRELLPGYYMNHLDAYRLILRL